MIFKFTAKFTFVIDASDNNIKTIKNFYQIDLTNVHHKLLF